VDLDVSAVFGSDLDERHRAPVVTLLTATIERTSRRDEFQPSQGSLAIESRIA
jgi:hypothetical protein